MGVTEVSMETMWGKKESFCSEIVISEFDTWEWGFILSVTEGKDAARYVGYKNYFGVKRLGIVIGSLL